MNYLHKTVLDFVVNGNSNKRFTVQSYVELLHPKPIIDFSGIRLE